VTFRAAPVCASIDAGWRRKRKRPSVQGLLFGVLRFGDVRLLVYFFFAGAFFFAFEAVFFAGAFFTTFFFAAIETSYLSE
jgi:hypothetical protein